MKFWNVHFDDMKEKFNCAINTVSRAAQPKLRNFIQTCAWAQLRKMNQKWLYRHQIFLNFSWNNEKTKEKLENFTIPKKKQPIYSESLKSFFHVKISFFFLKTSTFSQWEVFTKHFWRKKLKQDFKRTFLVLVFFSANKIPLPIFHFKFDPDQPSETLKTNIWICANNSTSLHVINCQHS